jgi:hypothetical protein
MAISWWEHSLPHELNSHGWLIAPTKPKKAAESFPSFPTLLLNEMPQLSLHRLESVVDHFGEWFVGAVVSLLFIGDQLMARRHGHINAHAKWISFLMRVIRLFNRDVAAADVITKTIEPGGLRTDYVFDFVGFFNAAISDINRQLHVQV